MTVLLRKWPLIHGLLFYFVWFVAVGAVSRPHGDLTAILTLLVFSALSVWVSMQRHGVSAAHKELRWLGLIALLGLIVDGAVVGYGVLQFPHTSAYFGWYPWWLVAMWICFGTAYSTSLSWLADRIVLQIGFGAIGGALSLFAAYRMGAVQFPLGIPTTAVIVAIEWAAVMVISFWLYKSIMRSSELTHES